MCFGAQRNRLIEKVLLSTYSICFGREIRKLIFNYAFLSGGLLTAFWRKRGLGCQTLDGKDCILNCINKRRKTICTLSTSSPENMTLLYSNNKSSDQDARPHSLISTFVISFLKSMITKLATC